MSIWKKLILILIFVVAYFSMLRPVRSYSAKALKSVVEIKQFETYSQSSVSITIIYKDQDFSKEFPFKMPFGMFFLFSGISLIMINVSTKELAILCIIQISFWLLAFLAMLIGSKGSLFFLEIMDMILRYLLPLFSLGFPAYLIMKKKMKAQELKYES